MKARFRRDCLFYLIIVTGLCGCNDSESETANAISGHARMLADLQQVQKDSAKHKFLGDGLSWRLRLDLAGIPPGSTDPRRFDLSWQLGYAELRMGRTTDAIKHIKVANDLLDQNREQIPIELARRVEMLLGVAYLRLGETENCVNCRGAESCLIPIRDGGIHQHPDGSRNAIKHFAAFLKRYPEDLTVRWLMNLAHMTLGTYPEQVPVELLVAPELLETGTDFPRFSNIAADVNLDTFNLAGGVVVDDFDNDGYLDIVTSSWDTVGQIHFFHNTGDGTFVDKTSHANLTGILGGLNLVQADYDNDGDIDVFVLRGAWLEQDGKHPNSLLQNNGKGVFHDVTYDVGLGDRHAPTQTASWGDYDNDGDLDLYVGIESVVSQMSQNKPTGQSQLFRNNGNGSFTDVAAEAGVLNERFAKGVIWGDYNNDRYPDLYVSNLGDPNRLYRNNRDGTFTDVATETGVDKPISSFPVWFWDFNNDGILDLFLPAYRAKVKFYIADILDLPHEAETDRLYQGNGEGGFRDVTESMHLDNVTLTMSGNFGDLDHDGFPDFYLGTGYPNFEGLVPNRMFRNHGGTEFEEITGIGGFGHLQKGHAIAFSDLDNDGDQDVFAQMGGFFRGDGFANALFENPGFGNHSITIKLVGTRSNRSAIGARISAEVVEDGKRRSIYKWVNSGGSFGANSLRQQIGLGKADRIEVLEILWPTSNQTQQFKNVSADQFIEITEGANTYRKQSWPKVTFRKEKEHSKR